ncbi:Inosine/uridine-preferring nucleoside hydrolase [Scheffersomyces xylosifermentans]|uniref:Inosine/uridine-preferring nucleoside hydrolase n=1 Tax=Scheffersomyces xylosifermentans TaxID=1304137 RepID=UPI00315D273A
MVQIKFSVAVASILGLTTAKKVFIDNDGLAPLQVLFPLAAGWEVLGISTSFGSSSVVDAAGTAFDILQTYNLSSCIPHYVGAQQPLLRTQDTFDAWQSLFGELVWQGAFASFYEDTYTWDNFTYNETLPGAIAMVEAVKANKDTDPVYIYAAGMMTTVAQAISIYPNLVKEAAGLYIMGGYFDQQYAAATGPSIVNDINTDINLMQDPEAAQIVLTANWSQIYIGANVTNYLVPSQALYDILINKAGGLSVLEDTPYFEFVSNLVATGNYSENTSEQTLPFWDEVVSAFMVWPDLIESTTNFSVAVDTSFYSPFYGSLRIWGADYAPKGAITGNATIVNKINDDKFYDLLVSTYFQDWRQYCEVGGPVALAGYE